MLAVRYFGKNDVRVVEIEQPTPKKGEVLLKIGAAGVCHSDLHVIQHGLFDYSFTLGHENAGWIAEMDESEHGFKKGDAVLVYGPWGCGHCHACQTSAENYCQHQAEIRAKGGGLGADGGMAEYMIVPSSRLLIPIGSLAPRHAASLTDAALTPYHAIKRSLSKLTADIHVVVLGVGGLGHMAIQLLKLMTPATIIAGDVDDEKLGFAKNHGADHTINTLAKDAAQQIKKITGSRGATVVLDCVGIQPTFDLGAQIVGLNSDWTVLGLGGGHHQFTMGSIPFGCSLSTPYWGTRSELMEVIALAQQNKITIETSEYPLKEANAVYQQLAEGKIQGRAVLIP